MNSSARLRDILELLYFVHVSRQSLRILQHDVYNPTIRLPLLGRADEVIE
jgi:hypothetical protein